MAKMKITFPSMNLAYTFFNTIHRPDEMRVVTSLTPRAPSTWVVEVTYESESDESFISLKAEGALSISAL